MEAQQEFDAKYVSSTEICRELGVTRATILNARRRGALPEPVRIDRPDGSPHVLLWLRDTVTPYIEKWRAQLDARRA
jgi:predicted DNA-binding transcriptional regulator AlpA